MEFRILGGIEAGSGTTVVDLGSPKQKALFAVLLLHVGRIVPIDRLIDLVWGEAPPRTAEHSIQIYVSELRKALEPIAGTRLIHRRPPGYVFDVPTDAIDANRFEALVQEGARMLAAGNRDEAVETLRSALALWRGPALSDFAYEEFAQPYVRRLNDLHLDAIETLAAAEIDAGAPGRAIPLLEAAVGDDPLRERSRELLMLALYRTGRHPEALRTYDRLRTLLVEELGLEPSPPLQQLRDRVLLHDPALMPDREPELPAATRNPYKGLQPFGERDAPDFFGRDALVEQMLASLRQGRRLVALVGPSGSGKSSVVAAGLLQRLRAGAIPGSGDWVIASLSLGADPLAEMRAVLERSGATGPAAGGTLPFPELGPHEHMLLVLDQFEQVFTMPDAARRRELLAALAAELSSNRQLTVLVTLRADFYDRPLQEPDIGELFVQGVLHVLPMNARELEAAIVGPAERVGVRVDSQLLAELVAEAAAHPGSLPLLQYALTELFDGRSGPTLTHAGYAALGGLRGVLTRRAEAVFLELDAEQQRIATQAFLRLVQPGRGTADSRRRITLAELSDLAADSVALSAVITAFGRQRLLTFDRDPATGQATVELAHEALLTEWERLSGWIDRHRAALRRRDALIHAVDEWELAGRHPDYLLTGARLDEFADWSRDGSLQLTGREQTFLDEGLELRRAQELASAQASATQRRQARNARFRTAALAGTVFLFAAAAAFAFFAAPAPPLPPVAYFWTDNSVVNNLAISGFDRGVTDFGLVGRKFSYEEEEQQLDGLYGDPWWEGLTRAEIDERWYAFLEDHVREVAGDGTGLVYVFGFLAAEIERIATAHPDTIFVFGPGIARQPNVVLLNADDSEPAYLAGAAAALKTESGTVGFIGGLPFPGVWGFHAGFEAGVRDTDPDIEVVTEYLSPDDPIVAFSDFDRARDTALDMYEAGADIIFHAAGDAGLGVFEAARLFSAEEGRHVWAIGVDSDQYWTVTQLPGVTDPEGWQAHILTSVLKPIEPMTYAVLRAYAERNLEGGEWYWGLAETGGEGISYSGGYLDDIRPQLEALRARIVSGEIEVPCVPQELMDQARALGMGPDDCHG